MSLQSCAGASAAVDEIKNLIILLLTAGCPPGEIITKVLDRCKSIKEDADKGYY